MRSAEPRWRVLGVVALLHLLLVLVVRPLLSRAPPAPPAAPTLQWVNVPPLVPPVVPPTRRTEARPVPRPRAPDATPPPLAAPPADTTLRLVEAAAPTPQAPASAASAPRRSVLDSPASRQALRALGQAPLLSERAAQSMGDTLQRTDGALAQEVQRAAKGDCMKGDYAGAGMGLLSLPALAVAAARGQCAR